MTQEEIMRALLNGAKIRRPIWASGSYTTMVNGQMIFYNQHGITFTAKVIHPDMELVVDRTARVPAHADVAYMRARIGALADRVDTVELVQEKTLRHVATLLAQIKNPTPKPKAVKNKPVKRKKKKAKK